MMVGARSKVSHDEEDGMYDRSDEMESESESKALWHDGGGERANEQPRRANGGDDEIVR